MELHLRRIAKKEKYTIGRLSINGVYFCDTIEDKDRGLHDYMSVESILKIKVKHETAIPCGRYKVVLSYSIKYNKILPELIYVKGFTGIRMHAGNTAEDSSGCIIVGQNKVKGKVIYSKKTMEKLMEILQSVREDIYITIE